MRFQNLLLEGRIATFAWGKMQLFNLQDLGLFMKILRIRKNNDTQTMQKTIENLQLTDITIYTGKTLKIITSKERYGGRQALSGCNTVKFIH